MENLINTYRLLEEVPGRINNLPPKYASAQKTELSSQLKKDNHFSSSKENQKEFSIDSSYNPTTRKRNSIALINKYQQAESILSKEFTISKRSRDFSEERRIDQKELEKKAIEIIESQKKKQDEEQYYMATLEKELILKDFEKKTLEDKCSQIIEEKSEMISNLEKQLFEEKINHQNLALQLRETEERVKITETEKQDLEQQLQSYQNQIKNRLNLTKNDEKEYHQSLNQLKNTHNQQIQKLGDSYKKIIQKQKQENYQTKQKVINFMNNFSQMSQTYNQVHNEIQKYLVDQKNQIALTKSCLIKYLGNAEDNEKYQQFAHQNLKQSPKQRYIYQSVKISDCELTSLKNQISELNIQKNYYEQTQENYILLSEHQRIIEEKLTQEKDNNIKVLEIEKHQSQAFSVQLKKQMKINENYKKEIQVQLQQLSETEDELMKIKSAHYLQENEISALKYKILILEKEIIQLYQQKQNLSNQLSEENKEKKELEMITNNQKYQLSDREQQLKDIKEIKLSLEKSISLLNEEKISLKKFGEEIQYQMDQQILFSTRELQKIKKQNLEMQKLFEKQDLNSLLQNQLSNQMEESNSMLSELQKKLNDAFQQNAELLQENQKLKQEISSTEIHRKTNNCINESIEENKKYTKILENDLQISNEQNIKLENDLEHFKKQLLAEQKKNVQLQLSSNQSKSNILQFFKQQIQLLHNEQNKLNFISSKQLKQLSFEFSHKSNRILQALKDEQINNQEQKIQIKVDLNAMHEFQQNQVLYNQKLHLEELASQQQQTLIQNINELNEKLSLQQKKFSLIENQNKHLNSENEIIWNQLKSAEKENETLREQFSIGKIKKHQMKWTNGSRKNSESKLN